MRSAVKYCKICKQRIIAIPFVGDKSYEFEDGTYCEKCASSIVEKRRRNLK